MGAEIVRRALAVVETDGIVSVGFESEVSVEGKKELEAEAEEEAHANDGGRSGGQFATLCCYTAASQNIM